MISFIFACHLFFYSFALTFSFTYVFDFDFSSFKHKMLIKKENERFSLIRFFYKPCIKARNTLRFHLYFHYGLNKLLSTKTRSKLLPTLLIMRCKSSQFDPWTNSWVLLQAIFRKQPLFHRPYLCQMERPVSKNRIPLCY